MYLTYDEYMEMGGELDEPTFVKYEFKARKIIDFVTANRVSKMSEIPESVKMCIADIIQTEMVSDGTVTNFSAKLSETGSTGLISSFTTDGYQESYSNGTGNAGEYVKTMLKNVSQAEEEIVRRYLYYEYDDNGVPLLYRGVY